MYKKGSVDKVSSKSLHKFKNKIQTAFFAHKHNQNSNTNNVLSQQKRSNSVKSLAISKSSTAEKNHLPFSMAIKNGLVTAQRKISSYSSNISSRTKYSQNKEQKKTNKYISQSKECMTFQHQILNEKTLGYCWYHNENKKLISVCKRKENQILRYFAIVEQNSVKKQKEKSILGAIENEYLYSGNKKFLLVSSNVHGKLLNGQQKQKAKLQTSQFILIIQEYIKNFININRLIRQIYELIQDGVRDMDSIINIIGRGVFEKQKKYLQNEKKQLFILIILNENKVRKFIDYFQKQIIQ